MKSITDSQEWRTLETHQKDIFEKRMKDWFNEDPLRFSHFSLSWGDMLFDYSKNRITQKTLALLIDLAHACLLPEKIHALFAAKPINATEKRPALHSALRNQTHEPILVNNKDIMPDILTVLEKMRQFTDAVRQKTWLGCTGKPIRDIVNIGIGGSHLGPLMVTNALADFAIDDLNCHFISNIDHAHIREILTRIDPETTLFIISSKSFTTLETSTNAKTICRWWQQKTGMPFNQHFVAVTAAPAKAIEFGIPPDNIFLLWDWVGGRYSVWSAVGLPVALMIGMENFQAFLQGGFSMDQHFRETKFSENMPILMALIGIWYINFFGATSTAFIPYAHYLNYFRVHLQQLEMESNGKNISHHGKTLNYATGPIIWGGQGCNGQHAFHQLLHQGQHFVPVDFVLVGKENSAYDHHDILVASGLSQAQALMQGKTLDEAYTELRIQGFSEPEATALAPHKIIPGNRPSNILFLNKITPYNLGALLACYEHKIFVQGAIWDINSFDQWGVELGKQLLPTILMDLQQLTSAATYDSSTSGLISHYKKTRNPA